MPAPTPTGFAPRGTQLQHSPDGATFTTIAKVVKIDLTGSKADTDDVTNMDSASSYREYLATLLNAGEVNFEVIFQPGDATQDIIDTDFDAQAENTWKLVLPNALGSATFNAFVVSRDYSLPHDKAGRRTLKLQITGPMTKTW